MTGHEHDDGLSSVKPYSTYIMREKSIADDCYGIVLFYRGSNRFDATAIFLIIFYE